MLNSKANIEAKLKSYFVIAVIQSFYLNLISTIVMKEINAYAFFILEMFKNQSTIRSTKKKWDRCYQGHGQGSFEDE